MLFTALTWLAFWIVVLVALRVVVRVMLTKNRGLWSANHQGIVITGASSGIGKQLALLYAKQGAKLAICARRQEELHAVAEECRRAGAESVLEVVADMSIEADCKRLMTSAASAWEGVIDCVILNAGISMSAPFDALSDSDMSAFRSIMDLNYLGSVHGTHYALPALIKSKRSKIVVVSSGLGLFGAPSRTGYSAAKFALHGFFEALRCELGPKYGTEITIICPGVVRTDINRTRVGPPSEGIDMSKSNVMPVEVAGDMIVASVARADRLLPMTTQIVAGQWLRFAFPELFDRILIRAISKFGKE